MLACSPVIDMSMLFDCKTCTPVFWVLSFKSLTTHLTAQGSVASPIDVSDAPAPGAAFGSGGQAGPARQAGEAAQEAAAGPRERRGQIRDVPHMRYLVSDKLCS